MSPSGNYFKRRTKTGDDYSKIIQRGSKVVIFASLYNGPFAASGHMVHAGGQAVHWDIQYKENSNLS